MPDPADLQLLAVASAAVPTLDPEAGVVLRVDGVWASGTVLRLEITLPASGVHPLRAALRDAWAALPIEERS